MVPFLLALSPSVAPLLFRLALVHGSVVADCEGLPRWLLFFPKVDVLRALGTLPYPIHRIATFYNLFFSVFLLDDYIHMPTFMQRSRTNSPPFLSLSNYIMYCLLVGSLVLWL